MQQLFLAASAPMVVGAVAAVTLVPLCYVRLGAMRLSDVPSQRRDQGDRAVLPEVRNGTRLPGSLRADD